MSGASTVSTNGKFSAAVEAVLDDTVRKLTTDGKPDLRALQFVINQLPDALTEHDPTQLEREFIRRAFIAECKARHYKGVAKLINVAFVDGKPSAEDSRALTPTDPEPSSELVNGSELLAALAVWFGRYLYLPKGAADAIALWTVATWFVADFYIAPILALLSATKRCGKTLLLDLLRLVVRRGCTTSGVGITTAVLFRLNDRDHPTFLIDEAEKLSGNHADRDLIAMLNVGHRRGARVQRCVERNGTHEIDEFDAFGFRALAAIRTLWNTVMDRTIAVWVQRKPRTVALTRFSGRTVEREGADLARRIRRWADDHSDLMAQAEAKAMQPAWLGDRECDNWSPLFAVAAVAGGEWPRRATQAAKALRTDVEEEGDHLELLIHDVRRVFEDEKKPQVLKSGELVRKLNEIETSPWGDYRSGDGLTTHKLAAMMRLFRMKPDQRRTVRGEKIRGYWLGDFRGVFARYPPPKVGQVGQVGQSSKNAGSEGFQSGTANALCPTLESAESPAKTGDVPVVPVVPVLPGGGDNSLSSTPSQEDIRHAREFAIGHPGCSRDQIVASFPFERCWRDAEAAVDALLGDPQFAHLAR